MCVCVCVCVCSVSVCLFSLHYVGLKLVKRRICTFRSRRLGFTLGLAKKNLSKSPFLYFLLFKNKKNDYIDAY